MLGDIWVPMLRKRCALDFLARHMTNGLRICHSTGLLELGLLCGTHMAAARIGNGIKIMVTASSKALT